MLSLVGVGVAGTALLLAEEGLPWWVDKPIGIFTLLVVFFLLGRNDGPIRLCFGREVDSAREQVEMWKANYELEREARVLAEKNTHDALTGNLTLEQFVEAFRAAAQERRS